MVCLSRPRNICFGPETGPKTAILGRNPNYLVVQISILLCYFKILLVPLLSTKFSGMQARRTRLMHDHACVKVLERVSNVYFKIKISKRNYEHAEILSPHVNIVLYPIDEDAPRDHRAADGPLGGFVCLRCTHSAGKPMSQWRKHDRYTQWMLFTSDR